MTIDYLPLPCLFLEMLVVFHGAPGAAPAEAVLDEEAVAGVGGVDEGDGHLAAGGAVGGVGLGIGGFHLAVVEVDVGVVEGIDVDGESLGVFGELGGARDDAEVEAGGVVGCHAALVVAIVVVDEGDALDFVALLVELTEDVEEVGSYGFVADDLAQLSAAVDVAMQHTEVAQGGAWNGAVLLVGLALHATEDGVGDGGGLEAGVEAVGADGFVADDGCGGPVAKCFQLVGGGESAEDGEEDGEK